MTDEVIMLGVAVAMTPGIMVIALTVWIRSWGK